MQDWFKARNNWGAGIETLSNEEAGQFAKALWAYTMRGEEQEITGSAKALYAIAIATLKQDEQATAEISQKRAAAGSIGGKQTQANASKEKQNEAKQANACNKNKNKNIETDIEKRNNRFIPPTVKEVEDYCNERQNGIDAQSFIDYYEANGWKQGAGRKPIVDWRACVRTWERNSNQTRAKPNSFDARSFLMGKEEYIDI